MSSLSDLPDDILGSISIRLNGFDNCSLWIASDSKLKQRLVNQVITEFNIKYKTSETHLWPGNFLKKLKRLSHLSLVVKEFSSQPSSLFDNVELFPIETLKYLYIECGDSLQIFLQDLISDDSTGPTTPSSSDINLKYINLNLFYPNLELFIVSDPKDLSIEFIACLPQNLKTLSLPRSDLCFDSEESMNECISILPRSLTALHLCVEVPDNVFLDPSFLPPNLTSLTINIPINQELYSKMPQNLQHLDLYSTDCDIQKLSPFLATGLLSISLRLEPDCVIGHSLSHLKNLKSIQISCTSGNPFLRAKSQKLKPFPDGLVELILDIKEGIDQEFFSMLPETITILSLICTVYPKRLRFFTLLPKHLQSFETNLVISENLSLLPDSLTDLHFKSAQENDIRPFSDGLPSKLQTLNLSADYADSILKKLPQTLTRLELESYYTLVDNQVIGNLPRGLKHLILDTNVGPFNTPRFITDTAEFPPHLETLHLFGNHNIEEDELSNLNLPKLTSFHLEMDSYMSELASKTDGVNRVKRHYSNITLY